jgi:hypothetical protein
MLQLTNNPGLRLRLGYNARDRALKLYSFELHAEEGTGLYHEVVESKTAKSARKSSYTEALSWGIIVDSINSSLSHVLWRSSFPQGLENLNLAGYLLLLCSVDPSESAG